MRWLGVRRLRRKAKSKPISTPSNPNSKGNGFYVCTWASTCEA
jgi:hypothetical protein